MITIAEARAKSGREEDDEALANMERSEAYTG
jgi:hypothetical protein